MKRIFFILFTTLIGLAGVPTILLYLARQAGPVRLTQERLTPPAPSAAALREILRRPRPIRLITLDTGIVHLDKTILLNPDQPAVAEFKDDGSPLRVFAHLIRHPERGDYLVDSGLDASFTNSPTGNIRWPGTIWTALASIYFSQRAGQDLRAGLAAHGAEPRGVFFTHLHVDHTSGLPALPGVQLFVGPGETGDILHLLDSGHLDGFQSVNEIDFSNAVRLDPLGPAVDVFGDGSFWAIHTPGHSDGHLSFLVNSDAGATLLTGDAIHMRWGFEHQVSGGGGTTARNTRAQASAEGIFAFAREFPEVRVILGHQL